MGTTRRVTAVLIAAAMMITACSGGGGDDEPAASDPSAPSTTGPGGATNTPITDDDRPSTGAGASTTSGSGEGAGPLGFTLSEGSPTASSAEPVTVAEGTALTVEQALAVLDRLPAWDVPAGDQLEFNVPPQSLGPPLVGETVEAPFPAPGDAPSTPGAVADGPLEVLRFQPEGEVDVAPFLSLTFNEPMVPLATLDQLDDEEVPVVVEPAIEGRWRWIGTRTLRFEVLPDPDVEIDRLPAATEYTVTVPAGTESANGAVLADDVTFGFATPPAEVIGVSGVGDSMPLDPVFVAEFDQRVDAEQILAVTSFESGDVGGVRLATPDEIEADPIAARLVDNALTDRVVAFVPAATLTPDTPVEIRIGPGIPSLEGPRTGDAFSTSGRTYPPLELERAECGYGDCRPLAPFTFDFTNRLDAEAFDPTWVRVEPAVPGLRAEVSGRTLSIRGVTSGNTTYEVSIAADLVDVFGQTLAEPIDDSFDVGEARPFLTGPDGGYVTTDPFVDTPGLAYTTTNHDELRVTAWQVTPDQYDDYLRYLDQRFVDAEVRDPDWPQVLDTEVAVEGDTDQIVETTVDLADAFAESGGPVVVRVQPSPPVDPRDDDYWQNRPLVTWVQSTTLGVDAFLSDDELLVWTTDLTTGEAVGGATVELLGLGDTVTTDDDGLARTPLPRDRNQGVTGLVATDGERTAMLPAGWFEGWTANPRSDQTRWYVIDDRGIYRPGETARIAGFVRELDGDDAQLALYSGDLEVEYRAFDSVGNELATGTAPVNALGGFNLAVEIPEESNTGSAFVEMQLLGVADTGSTFWGHEFQVQDFRTPDFEVTARNESPGPYYLGEPATVAVEAEYFAGGPLPDAEVRWLVSTTDTSYSPPNRDEFQFGIWTPWWYGPVGFDEPAVFYEDEFFFEEECFDCFPSTSPRFQEFTGRTGADGAHYLQIDFERTDADGEPLDQPTSVTAESTVFDVDRQAFADRTDVLVHPAEFYVGLRSERTFVRQGEPIEIDAIVVDVDGESIEGSDVTVTAGRREFGWVGGTYTEELVDAQECVVTSDGGDDGVRCDFATEIGGEYEITAVVTDDAGRTNRAVYTQWVSGSTAPPTRNLEQGQVTIVPDAETYAGGDTAELLIQAPFAPATGLVTVTRAGIESTQVVDAPDGSAVVEIPIADDDVPALEVRVDMVGSAERVGDDGTPLPDAPRRPAFAVGAIGLSIPPVSRTLDVVATPASPELEPGASTSVEVAVTGADGEPVADSGVVVMVVDEAVLSLTGYELADPLDAFYASPASFLSAELIRRSIRLANPDLLDLGVDQDFGGEDDADEAASDDGAFVEEAMEEESAMEAPADVADADTAGTTREGGGAEPISVRADFDALAVFAPDEVTGADGTLTVDVDLPDNLTRYRVMAVAVDGADRFGSGESTVTARLPISLRPSAPRFLNFGDVFELPVVVQNQTDGDLEVDVAVEVANLGLTDELDSGRDIPIDGRRVTVPANDRIEVRFPASAAEVGTARFRVAGAAGEFADAAEVDLPVYTPATSEAFATYGVVDDDAPIAQPVLAPEGVFPQFGGLEVSTSSTALSSLTDAVLYLYDYRYDSADGYAARIMAVAALRDVLDAFDAAGLPDEDELEAQVADDIERLQALQNGDGGFPYFQRGRESVPWVSVTATHGLVLARDNGYTVDEGVLEFALQHLRDIESYIPPEYSDSTRDAISAYALYVRDLAGDSDPGKALDLYRSSDTLQMDSLARLWPVLTDSEARAEIEREVDNSAVETPAAATFATSYGEDAYLIAHSDRRTDGIVLGALITEDPDNDIIPKVVTGLLGNQNQGRWRNVYENVHILLSLNEYFDTFESVDPDFVARAWLGDTYAVEEDFVGRSTETRLTTVPMSNVVDVGDTDLVIAKDGAGRLYYRLGMEYAPSDLDLDPRDEGFVVERVYEAIDDPDDVVRNADGSWTVRAGASVRVTLTMVADARRTHVALVDPLPAGFEAVNPALATSVTVPLSDPSARTGYWWWQWYEYQNLRDDRSEAFTSYLPGGTYEYTYVARATTPGEFVVPPTKAEEIYAPEVFGRSSSDRVLITGS